MKKFLILGISVLSAMTMLATPVDQEAAEAKALAFLNGKASAQSGKAKASRRMQDISLSVAAGSYYVFNVADEGGFVVVSGSDLTPSILGYAENGAFQLENAPSHVKAWLQGYADQIAFLESCDVEAATKARRSAAVPRASIAPMIQTLWDQDNPYNLDCPADINDGDKSVTGCVATAMAQVLYYDYQKEGFPVGTTKPIPSYLYKKQNWVSSAQMPETSQINFDWANMKTSYTGEETEGDASATAVAALMVRCGASIGMTYANNNNGGSSASTGNVAQALNDYFGYDHSVQYLKRGLYSATEWESIIYAELEAGRPVLYGGQSSGGGHAFVCDGYSEDGYFHINWGWGGLANSYFLLSVLNPYTNSGIGSSKSADGYTMEQDIVIGIQKPTGFVAEEKGRLSVAAFGIKDTTSPITVNRSNNANDVSIQYIYYNELTYTYSFDSALGMFDEEGNLVAVSGISQMADLEHNSGMSGYGPKTIDLSEAVLPTGKTYTLKAISRICGTEEWFQCFRTDEYYIQVEGISPTQVTFTPVTPVVDLVASDVTLTTDGVANTVQTVTATITNGGSNTFRGNVHLVMDGSIYAGYGIEVPKGGSAVATFSFKPGVTGTKTVGIYRETETGFVPIGSGTITLGDAANDSPELTLSAKMNIADDKYILGTKLIATLTATNETDSNYSGYVSMFPWVLVDGHLYTKSSWHPISVPAHSSVDIDIESDVKMDSLYSIQYAYIHNGERVFTGSVQGPFYTVVPAVTSFASDGSKTLSMAKVAFDVPADAVAVDLRGQSKVTTVTPNGNPNTLYLIDESAATPAGITDNVVKGSVAENISLTDGYDFYTPVDFTAGNISYQRTFTQGATAEGAGWSTLVLPFDVERIFVGGKSIDWFRNSEDTGKQFWLYAFSSDGVEQVNFDYTENLKADTPYIVNVPGNAWGESHNLVGKAITFAATDARIKSDSRAVLTGYNYLFKGVFMQQTLGDAYVLNDAGTQFVKSDSAPVGAFRAYFTSSARKTTATALAIGFEPANEATGVPQMEAETEAENSVTVRRGVYNLQGVKLGTVDQLKMLPRGIYIVDGKIIIK